MESKFQDKFKHNKKADFRNLKHLYPDQDDKSSLFGSVSPAKENVLDVMYTIMHQESGFGANATFGDGSDKADIMN